MLQGIKDQLKRSFPIFFHKLKNLAHCCGYRAPYFTTKVSAEDFFMEPDISLNQFFFDTKTTEFLIARLNHFTAICCLCAPRLAHEWVQRGKTVTLLDMDERFVNLPGFTNYDLRSPRKLSTAFDLIFADPPFTVTAGEIRNAIDAIASQSGKLTLCLIFPIHREQELFSAFNGWPLERIPLKNLRWNNIKESHHTKYGFYSNNPSALNP